MGPRELSFDFNPLALTLAEIPRRWASSFFFLARGRSFLRHLQFFSSAFKRTRRASRWRQSQKGWILAEVGEAGVSFFSNLEDILQIEKSTRGKKREGKRGSRSACGPRPPLTSAPSRRATRSSARCSARPGRAPRGQAAACRFTS